MPLTASDDALAIAVIRLERKVSALFTALNKLYALHHCNGPDCGVCEMYVAIVSGTPAA